jgi:hypothetical protein
VFSKKNEVKNGRKKCNLCGKIKSLSYFYKRPNGRVKGHCKDCNYEMVKKNRKENPQKHRDYYKKYWKDPKNKEKKYLSAKNRQIRIKLKCVEYMGGGCSVCGYDKCIEALEFHHLDPKTKDKDLSHGRGVDTRISFDNLKRELNKCILVCANCHREKHYEERR